MVMKLRSRYSASFFLSGSFFLRLHASFLVTTFGKCGFDLASGALASSFITELCVEHICLLNLT